jgi:formylglycine-generating enzyme required for sulfatase activity
VIPGERPTAPADRGSPRTDNTGPAQPPTPEVTTQPPPLIPPPTPPAPQTLPPASRPAVAISTTPPATGPSPTAPYAAELARHKAAAAAAQAKYDAAFTDDPAYQQAKAAAGQAKAAVDSLGDTATPGSPDLVAASQKLVDAKAALAKESSRVTATQRQLQVTILLETAKANDTQVSGHVALGALNDLLRLDPQNAEALALQGKISAYYTVRNSLGMTLIAIAPGRFLMGSPANEKDRSDDETQHAVTLTKGFFMGTTHVTVAQFAAFAQNANYQTDAEKQGWATGWNGSGWAHINGSSWRKPQEEPEYTQADDHPVVSVSWNDAVAFCDWLSKKEGEHYRLPTEAEFEYAARAGTQTAYWWSSNPDDGLGCANLIDRTASMKIPNWSAGAFHWSDGYYFTSPVGKFRANAWGLYDMVGNAWEWCNDWYGGYPQGDATDPTGPAVGTERTARGSGWSDFPKTSRCAMRGKCAPSDGQDFIGFRVVLDSE